MKNTRELTLVHSTAHDYSEVEIFRGPGRFTRRNFYHLSYASVERIQRLVANKNPNNIAIALHHIRLEYIF